MPSKTKKQANFMAAVANNPKFAKKAGVPQSVGKDFAKADKGKTFQEGGYMPGMKSTVKKSLRDAEAKEISRQDNDADALSRVKKRKVNDGREAIDSEEQEARYETDEARARAKLKKMRDDAARQEGMMMGGKVKGYMKGGKTQGYNDRLDESMGARNGSNSQSMTSRRNESKGMEKSMGRGAYSGASTMMKKGGKVGKSKSKSSASSRADGIARKGHTRGKMV